MTAGPRTIRRGKMLVVGSLLSMGVFAVDLAPAQADPPRHAPAYGYRNKQTAKEHRKWEKHEWKQDHERDKYERKQEQARLKYERKREKERAKFDRKQERERERFERRRPEDRFPPRPPLPERLRRDTDGDGIPDSRDRDRDGDGMRNHRDRYPLDPSRW